MLFLLASGLRIPAAADETTPLLIDKLRITRDAALTNARWMCANDGVGRFIDGAIERDLEAPTREAFCETAAEEATRRGTLDALYARYGSPPREVWRTVLKQALKNRTAFATADGQKHAITCPLAFEAGYRFGVEHPDKAVGSNLSDRDIAAMEIRCFEPDSTLSRADGLVVGTRRAQTRQRELAAR